MLSRVLISLFVIGLPSLAQAKVHHARKAPLLATPLAPLAPTGMVEGQLDAETGIGPAVPPPIVTTPGFFATHSKRVERDLMLFQPTLVGLLPGARRNAELVAKTPNKKKKEQFSFFTPLRTADDLEVHRDRDRLALFRTPQPQGSAVALGLAMFASATIASAHAPRPLRVLFDGPVHIGPAIFDGGGMGAGLSGRWL